MKTTWNHIAAMALAALLVVGTFTGCAGTATRESTGEYVDDTVITTKVKTALLGDDDVRGLAVNVETFRGVVQLSGFVNSELEKRQAERVASGIKGVRGVTNNLIVKEDAPDR